MQRRGVLVSPTTVNREARLRRLAVRLLLSGLLLIQQTGMAAMITVDGICTLIDAITAANSDAPEGSCASGASGQDVLDVQVDTLLTVVNNTTNGANGLPAVTSNILIMGNDHSVTRANVSQAFRIFDVEATGFLQIDSLTVSQGKIDNTAASPLGGGISNSGTLILRNSTVSDNEITQTVGLGTYRGGGAIANEGTLTVLHSFITNNSVSQPDRTFGGGIFHAAGSLSISNSTISGNSATQSNSSTDPGYGARGGGIASYGATSDISLTNSTVSDNSVYGTLTFGGGVYKGVNNGYLLTITNSTISGNSVDTDASRLGAGSGGGIAVVSALPATIANSTISGNYASGGGGVHHYGFGLSGATLTLVNNILADSSNWPYSLYSFTHCLDSEALSSSGSSFAIINAGNNLADSNECMASGSTIPPSLPTISLTLADNGGPTKTHALLPGGGAIDAAGVCGLETDQRTFVRIDGTCDSGAFELNACEDDLFENDPTAQGFTDDTCSGSEISLLDTPYSHNLCDQDWSFFAPLDGATYEIETSNLVGGADTVLELRSGCGPILATDDDGGTGLGSKITYTALPGQDFLDIRVQELIGYTLGRGYDLTVRCIADCNCTATGGNNLFLESTVDIGVVNHEACTSINVGPSYTTGSTGVVTMTAGSVVRFNDDSAVDPGGQLTVGTDPSLQALGPLSAAAQGRSVRHLLTVSSEEP